MATYLIINLVFIATVLIAFKITPRKPSKKLLLTAAMLVILTAVFDSLLVAFDIIDYNPQLILGVRIGKAPVEDFFYAVLAVVLVPTVWNLTGNRQEKRHDRDN